MKHILIFDEFGAINDPVLIEVHTQEMQSKATETKATEKQQMKQNKKVTNLGPTSQYPTDILEATAESTVYNK